MIKKECHLVYHKKLIICLSTCHNYQVLKSEEAIMFCFQLCSVHFTVLQTKNSTKSLCNLSSHYKKIQIIPVIKFNVIVRGKPLRTTVNQSLALLAKRYGAQKKGEQMEVHDAYTGMPKGT